MIQGAKVRGAKVKAWQRGRNAERVAAWYLRARGYRILAERYKTPSGEIDLIATRLASPLAKTIARPIANPIASRRRHLVFVEVKARATLQDGLEAISPRQQQRIRAAAETFLARNASGTGRGAGLAPRLSQCRFDAIIITPGRFGLPRVTHRPNAWV